MAQIRDWLVRLALAASVLLIGYFVVAALGVRFGLWGVGFGFGALTLRIGPLLAFGALGFAAIAVLLALLVTPRRGAGFALAALLLPAILVGGLLKFRSQAQAVPPIHDISTDLLDPPGFSAEVVEARTAQGANSLELRTKRVPELGGRFGAAEGQLSTSLQRQAYSDIVPITLAAAPSVLQARALQVAKSLGWAITRQDAAEGVIEAQEQSFWFGFVDDIAIRIRPGSQAQESVVDIRSVSRVGISDVGANAKRVRAFTAALLKLSSGDQPRLDTKTAPTPCCAAAPESAPAPASAPGP